MVTDSVTLTEQEQGLNGHLNMAIKWNKQDVKVWKLSPNDVYFNMLNIIIVTEPQAPGLTGLNYSQLRLHPRNLNE